MNIPIIQSILHGSLRPNLCNLKFMELETKFEQLPDTLPELERLFITTFPDIRFDFDSERPFCLDNISSKDFTPLDDEMICRCLTLPLPEPTSPKEGFYQSIVKAETLRIKLAILDFSAKQQSDVDTKYEIKSTLTNIIKHIKYIDNNCDTILSTLRTQLICLYVELSQMASPLLEHNKDYYHFKNLMYEIFDRYPTKEESEAYQKFVGNTQEEKIDKKNSIMPDSEEFVDNVIKTKYEIFINVVTPYHFDELDRVRTLNKAKRIKLINMIISNNANYAVPMLVHIGYFDKLKNEYGMNKINIFKHFSKALGRSERDIKGNYNALNPNSKEDRYRYNSANYLDAVKSDYQKLIDNRL